jgi:hypothetical protein
MSKAILTAASEVGTQSRARIWIKLTTLGRVWLYATWLSGVVADALQLRFSAKLYSLNTPFNFVEWNRVTHTEVLFNKRVKISYKWRPLIESDQW